MMKNFVQLLIAITLTSCAQVTGNKPDHDFTNSVLELTIQTSTGEFVQFPDLYTALGDRIPDDKDERLILAERLKKKGFNVIRWGRGNSPLGPRVISLELRKDNCVCTVRKEYLLTTLDSTYQIVEAIRCKKDSL